MEKKNSKELLEFKYSIGQKIKSYRKESQEALAEKAQLSRDTISEIECGNVVMGIDSLVNICNALQITPNDILEDFIDNKIGILNNEIVQQISSTDLSAEDAKFILETIKYIKHNRKN